MEAPKKKKKNRKKDPYFGPNLTRPKISSPLQGDDDVDDTDVGQDDKDDNERERESDNDLPIEFAAQQRNVP